MNDEAQVGVRVDVTGTPTDLRGIAEVLMEFTTDEDEREFPYDQRAATVARELGRNLRDQLGEENS